jgi:hypothetical protein
LRPLCCRVSGRHPCCSNACIHAAKEGEICRNRAEAVEMGPKTNKHAQEAKEREAAKKESQQVHTSSRSLLLRARCTRWRSIPITYPPCSQGCCGQSCGRCQVGRLGPKGREYCNLLAVTRLFPVGMLS